MSRLPLSRLVTRHKEVFVVVRNGLLMALVAAVTAVITSMSTQQFVLLRVWLDTQSVTNIGGTLCSLFCAIVFLIALKYGAFRFGKTESPTYTASLIEFEEGLVAAPKKRVSLGLLMGYTACFCVIFLSGIPIAKMARNVYHQFFPAENQFIVLLADLQNNAGGGDNYAVTTALEEELTKELKGSIEIRRLGYGMPALGDTNYAHRILSAKHASFIIWGNYHTNPSGGVWLHTHTSVSPVLVSRLGLVGEYPGQVRTVASDMNNAALQNQISGLLEYLIYVFNGGNEHQIANRFDKSNSNEASRYYKSAVGSYSRGLQCLLKVKEQPLSKGVIEDVAIIDDYYTINRMGLAYVGDYKITEDEHLLKMAQRCFRWVLKSGHVSDETDFAHLGLADCFLMQGDKQSAVYELRQVKKGDYYTSAQNKLRIIHANSGIIGDWHFAKAAQSKVNWGSSRDVLLPFH